MAARAPRERDPRFLASRAHEPVRRQRLAAAVACLAVFAFAAPCAAQLRPGVQASYALDQFSGVFGLGGRLVAGLPAIPVRLVGSADYYFPRCVRGQDCDYWQANANIIVSLPLLPIPLFRYVGGGWNYQRVKFTESATARGINVLGGVDVSDTAMFEIRYEFMDGQQDQFVITVGVLLL